MLEKDGKVIKTEETLHQFEKGQHWCTQGEQTPTGKRTDGCISHNGGSGGWMPDLQQIFNFLFFISYLNYSTFNHGSNNMLCEGKE